MGVVRQAPSGQSPWQHGRLSGDADIAGISVDGAGKA